MPETEQVTLVVHAEVDDRNFIRVCRWCMKVHPYKQDGCERWPAIILPPTDGHKADCDAK